MYGPQAELVSIKTAPVNQRKFWLSEPEYRQISKHLSGESKALFQLLLTTGQQFRKLQEIRWHSFNARLGTIDLGDRVANIPIETANTMDQLRDKAISESSHIFSMLYKNCWWHVSQVYFKLGICQKAGCLKLPKFTYARKHFDIYRNKTRLAKDMGLTTTRWIPKPVFQTSGESGCLIQL